MPKLEYDSTTQKPVIRQSICTGEKAAGFQDIRTGKFSEIMLIQTPNDMKTFLSLYGLSEGDVKVIY